MAGPAAAVAAITATGTALSAFGQARAGERAAEASKLNRELAERQASQIELQGRVRDRQLRREAGRVFGRQAVLGAKGNFADTGQLLELTDRSALELERDAALNRFDTTERANAARFGGQLEEFGGKQQRRAARTQVVGTLLGGAGQGLLQQQALRQSRSD